jgi:predicted NAD/FAD-dependent oxidoreductase
MRNWATVAVVGAGVSGSMCAHRLANKGFDVSVFDKAKGAGGRTATRRTEAYAFDHGAQYFTVEDPQFRGFVDCWLKTGIVAEWSGQLIALRNGVPSSPIAGQRYVGVPGMSSLARDLLSNSTARFGAMVETVRSEAGAWHLALANQSDAGPFDVLVIATPPAQALAMAAGATALAEQARQATMQPCWTEVVALPTHLDVPFDAAFVEGSALSWIARDSCKPGRQAAQDVWVLHASAEWSREHIEHSSDYVSEALFRAFEESLGRSDLQPQHLLTHRWRYAQPVRSQGPRSVYDRSMRIGFCGDWRTEGRVEAAALSGVDLAQRVIAGQV